MAYINPIPHFGGKKYLVVMEFSFEDWVEKAEAVASIEDYIKTSGIPEQCVQNITPIEEYR